jgi:hypothetical protein
MMLQPGLEPKDCPNYETCGSASRLTPEEEVDLIRVREIQRQEYEARWEAARQQLERTRETIRINRHQAAVMMLRERGNPQSMENFGVLQSIANIEARIQELQSGLEHFNQDCYIAPDNCEAHRYNVKRPRGTYWYNKITSTEAMFEPAVKEEKVKVIHLSHDDDPRNIEGRMGIERRNRLNQIQTQLRIAEEALNRAIELSNLSQVEVLAAIESNQLEQATIEANV